MNRRLNDQVAVVTGAAQGIGKVIAMRLAAEGAHVVLTDILPTVDDAAAELRQRYPDNRAYAAPMDVTQGVQVNCVLDDAARRLGRLDLLVNNAGANHPMTPLTDISDETFDRIVGINLRGTFNGCRAAARIMREQGSGGIVNIGSWYGKQGFANFSVYCCTKAAVIRLTECLALELAPHGIRVNSICPGNMATDMHWNALREEAKIRSISFEQMDRLVKDSIPLGQQGSPEEIAAAVVFLASDQSAYITGQAINVNGGCLFH